MKKEKSMLQRALLVIGLVSSLAGPAECGLITVASSNEVVLSYYGSVTQTLAYSSDRSPVNIGDVTYDGPGSIEVRASAGTGLVNTPDVGGVDIVPASLSVSGSDPGFDGRTRVSLGVYATAGIGATRPTESDYENIMSWFTNISFTLNVAEGDTVRLAFASEALNNYGNQGSRVYGFSPFASDTSPFVILGAGNHSFNFHDSRLAGSYGGLFSNNGGYTISAGFTVVIDHKNGSGTTTFVADPTIGVRNLSAVPEPHSIALCGIAGVTCLGYFGRRWRTQAA